MTRYLVCTDPNMMSLPNSLKNICLVHFRLDITCGVLFLWLSIQKPKPTINNVEPCTVVYRPNFYTEVEANQYICRP